jgi:hypothetical protein
MSSLLEQAIIDAKMLKETARKNAEAAILEKYSSEIKQSIEMLLEQDEIGPADLAAAPDSGTTPDLGVSAPEATPETKKIMDKIPAAYLGENNMDEVELDLDSLVEKIDNMKKELNVHTLDTQEEFSEVIPQMPSRIASDTLAEGMPETAEENQEEEEEESLEEVFELNEMELEEMQLGPEFSEQELNAQIAAAKNMPPTASSSARITSLQAQLDALRKKKAAAKLAEEITVDMKVVTPGGLQGNQIETDKQIAIAKALAAQLEDLKEHLKIKDIEIQSLQSDLMIAEATLEETKGMLTETKAKLKKSTSINIQLKESFELFTNKLNEVNLINARLLYSNKVLRNASFNERQRDQIAEAISQANTVEEAKTVYETLQKTMQTVVEKRTAPQSLSEAIHKAPSPFLPRVVQTNSDPVAERWKLIAGIKK